MPEIVPAPPAGRLFEGEAEQLADALAEAVAGPPSQALAVQCRQAAEPFALPASLAAYTGIYERLLGRQPAG
jgi:hypothetical protein